MKSNKILYVVFAAIILFYLFKNYCKEETLQEGFTSSIKNMEICPVELLGRKRDCTAGMNFNKQFGDKYYTDLDHRRGKRYTISECAKGCMKDYGKDKNEIFMSHGRLKGKSNEECMSAGQKCRCYCSKKCRPKSPGKTHNAYSTYKINKCGKNFCFSLLKEHRESKGIQIEEISEYTKINPVYIEAIEEDAKESQNAEIPADIRQNEKIRVLEEEVKKLREQRK